MLTNYCTTLSFLEEFIMKTTRKRMALPIVLVLSVITLNACSSNAGTGAVVGALAGGAIGKSTGNHHDSRAATGAVIGAAAGAVIGSQGDIQRPQYQRPQQYQRPYYR